MRISGNQGCSCTDAHLLLLQMQQLFPALSMPGAVEAFQLKTFDSIGKT
jgi:hypothetical protein